MSYYAIVHMPIKAGDAVISGPVFSVQAVFLWWPEPTYVDIGLVVNMLTTKPILQFNGALRQGG